MTEVDIRLSVTVQGEGGWWVGKGGGVWRRILFSPGCGCAFVMDQHHNLMCPIGWKEDKRRVASTCPAKFYATHFTTYLF